MVALFALRPLRSGIEILLFYFFLPDIQSVFFLGKGLLAEEVLTTKSQVDCTFNKYIDLAKAKSEARIDKFIT